MSVFRSGFDSLLNVVKGSLGRREGHKPSGTPVVANEVTLHELTASMTDPAYIAVELKHPYVLLYNKRLAGLKDLLPLLEATAKAGRPLLIFAQDFDDEILSALAINQLRGSLNVMAVKAPGLGDALLEQLKDIAVLTSGLVISDKLGSVGLHDLGQAKRVIIDKDRTTLIAGAGKPEAITARAKQLQAELAGNSSEQEKSKLHERLGKLLSGVAVIRVGATSQASIG